MIMTMSNSTVLYIKFQKYFYRFVTGQQLDYLNPILDDGNWNLLQMHGKCQGKNVHFY